LNLEITKDMEKVKNFISIPEIWERASDPEMDKESYYPSCDDMTGWFMCTEKDKEIGIILVHYDNTTTLKIHPYILKEYRFMGRNVMKKLYEWFLTLPEQLNKIVITYFRNGKLYGQWCLGITRKEIREYL